MRDHADAHKFGGVEDMIKVRPRLATAFMMAGLALLVLACGQGRVEGGESGAPISVRGFIIQVEARSLTELDWLVVVDEKGVRRRFEARGFKGFTPSHLRSHAVQGHQITVTYFDKNGALIIDAIAD